jgi:hypothetical protein
MASAAIGNPLPAQTAPDPWQRDFPGVDIADVAPTAKTPARGTFEKVEL